MSREYIVGCLTLFFLAFLQNVAFSVVSRSRNRNNIRYHLVAAFFSNATWYLTFRSLVTAGMTLDLFWWYCAGTMIGSCTGVKISMRIEKCLGIGSDDHIKKTTVVQEILSQEQLKDFKRRLDILWEQHPQGFFNTPGHSGRGAR